MGASRHRFSPLFVLRSAALLSCISAAGAVAAVGFAATRASTTLPPPAVLAVASSLAVAALLVSGWNGHRPRVLPWAQAACIVFSVSALILKLQFATPAGRLPVTLAWLAYPVCANELLFVVAPLEIAALAGVTAYRSRTG